MIRLCPLPFSLSNGAMSTIPSVHWASFALATACATPKLFLHVFIGSRMAEIAEHGGTMDAKTKAISYISIICGSLLGIITGWVIYRQTTARARQLEADASALEANTAGLSGAYIDDDATDEDDDLVSLQNGNAIDNRIGG